MWQDIGTLWNLVGDQTVQFSGARSWASQMEVPSVNELLKVNFLENKE